LNFFEILKSSTSTVENFEKTTYKIYEILKKLAFSMLVFVLYLFQFNILATIALIFIVLNGAVFLYNRFYYKRRVLDTVFYVCNGWIVVVMLIISFSSIYVYRNIENFLGIENQYYIFLG